MDLARFFIVTLVVFSLIWVFLRNSFEGYDSGEEPRPITRIGPRYEEGGDDNVNTFITDINKGLDSSLKEGCGDLPGMGNAIGRAATMLPPTCRQAFANLPNGSKQLVDIIRPYMCNKDDTVNRKGFVEFMSKIGGSVCAPYLSS